MMSYVDNIFNIFLMGVEISMALLYFQAYTFLIILQSPI